MQNESGVIVPPPVPIEPDAAQPAAPGHMPRYRWLLLALLLAVIAWAVVCFDWNLFKGYAERRVSAATGREFHIDGSLDVDLSMNPLVTMDGLRLGNIAGAKEPTMASAQRLQFHFEIDVD